MKVVTQQEVIKAARALLNIPRLRDVFDALAKQGGRSLLVGGAVRDLFLGIPTKDLDIEVHGLALEQLEKILQQYGVVSLMGKAYGVLRVHGLAIDWSVPRREGPGRKPAVTTNALLNMREAFERRDLTMNALGIDTQSFEIIDLFNGLEDLQKGVLRACNKQRFTEDPLRFYRVMQFVGRFAMQPDDNLNNICKSMDVTQVSIERIEQELKKLLLMSVRPSLGFRWVYSIGRLTELCPELGALVGVKQNKKWHPEEDVFEHTMQTIDAVAHNATLREPIKLTLMYAALCHDMGKAVATHGPETCAKECAQCAEYGDGQIHSKGHAQAGVPLAKQFMQRVTREKDLIDAVIVLVQHHMAPLQFVKEGAKINAYKRLALALAPHATMHDLAQLALADRQGRNPQGQLPLTQSFADVDTFCAMADKAQVLMAKEEPVLQGRDLLDVVPPGPQLGKLVHQAYEIQLEEGIKDKQELKRRVLSFLNKKM